MRQDSKTRHLLQTIFITTSLSGLRPDTRITLRKTPLRCPYPFKLYSEACDLRHTRPDAPVLPCTPIGLHRSQQPTARYWFYSFPQPQSMILHALPSSGHRNISFAYPCPCRPIPAIKSGRLDSGRSGELHPAAPGFSRTSSITSMRLTQSACWHKL